MTFIETSELDEKVPREGWSGRFFHSPSMTFAYYSAQAGAGIHPHAHSNDEVWNVIEGQPEITGETRAIGPSGAAVIPPETTHSVKAFTNIEAIVVDHPPRQSIGGIKL
jgi:mannose-6-phosphate isomerase-like protein (cupin superfamily)